MGWTWHSHLPRDELILDLSRLSYDLHKILAEEYGGSDKWGYRALDTYVGRTSAPVRKRLHAEHLGR